MLSFTIKKQEKEIQALCARDIQVDEWLKEKQREKNCIK